MKKFILIILVLTFLIFVEASSVFAVIGLSSEWEATGFNNGRRIVRDSNGYFHAFWHSQTDPTKPPTGLSCQIFYSHTIAPAAEPPSMDLQGKWAKPIDMTSALKNYDNRYPSVAIEYEIYDKDWKGVNNLHVVWQATIPGVGNRYEVLYADIAVTNPPGDPAPWPSAINLSNTPKTDSLVPAIAINSYGSDAKAQHIHVVWQEEDIYPPSPSPTRTPTKTPTLTLTPTPGAMLKDNVVPLITFILPTWTPTHSIPPILTPTPTSTPTITRTPTPTLTPTPTRTPTPTPTITITPTNAFSNIIYIRSIDSGVTWHGPAGGWAGHEWDNLTQKAINSQMPSISCILDQYSGLPPTIGKKEYGYNSDDVHVTFNEDISGGFNVYYLRSTNDGLNWNPRINVTQKTGGTIYDAYSNIAVDMRDNPHIVFMRNNMDQSEPLRIGGPDDYLPGINPALRRSFPGPEIGMYGARINSVIYVYYDGSVWDWKNMNAAYQDQEFPTVALDRRQNVSVKWQQFLSGDYEIFRASRLNMTAPAYPLNVPVYPAWPANPSFNDSNATGLDDLFPGLAFNKVAQYYIQYEGQAAGYDAVHTKVIGHGVTAAIAGVNKGISQEEGNMFIPSPTPLTTPTPTVTPTP